MNRSKGFTLNELLVLIAIIALLLSVIVPALGKVKIYAQRVMPNIYTFQKYNDTDDLVLTQYFESGQKAGWIDELSRVKASV